MDRRDAVINSMNWHCAHTDKVATQQSGAVFGFSPVQHMHKKNSQL